jgi:hypothetical protein
MRSASRPGGARNGRANLDLLALSMAGLGFWFLVGLPWGPHNETFDWIVRLEQRTFLQSVFEPFPSVLSLRPLGTGPAWLLYRLGGHDVALVEVLNALLALAAWGYAAGTLRERRLFSLLAFVAGGVFFAGYIWVFHLHGIFYGPLLLFTAALARAARVPPDLSTLMGVFVGGVLTALVHPYALPLAVAFVAGALIETPRLRTPPGVATAGVVLTGVAAAYLLLVPGGSRALSGSPLVGLMQSYRTIEVNAVGSSVAALLAAWTATRAASGAAGGAAGLLTLVVAAGAILSGVPVLPLWFAWVAVKLVRRGRWTLAALLAACALLPAPNPTGSPTYAIFAVFVAAFSTALDDLASDTRLQFLDSPRVGAAVLAVVLLAFAVRSGWPHPALSRVAGPLLAEGERTRQFEVLVDRLMQSDWSAHPARFVRPAQSPSEADALDRRFRPPTDDHHLGTWLDWRRGGPAGVDDTLWFGFGGDAPPGMDTLLAARGRYAGDALVLRRSSARKRADTLTTSRP